MTISSTTNRNRYEGNDSATSFDFDFLVTNKDYIKVVHRDASGVETVLTEGTDYTVSGVGNNSGGSITYPVSGSPLPSGEFLVLVPDYPLTQTRSWPNQGGFLPETFEKSQDEQAMQIQQLAEQLGRAALFPVSDSGAGIGDLPTESKRAGKQLAFDSDGKPTTTLPTDASLVAEAAAVPRRNNANNAWRADYVCDTQSIMSAVAPANGDVAQLLGRSTRNDGGGGVFIFNNSDLSTEVSNDPQEGIYIAPDSDDTGASGAWVRQINDAVTPEMFGATGSGDDTAALEAALKVSAQYTLVVTRDYGVSQQLSVPFGATIVSRGSSFDASEAQASGFNDAILHLGDADAITQMPDLASDIQKRDRSIDFNSDPDLQKNDVIIIYNPTDYSWHSDKPTYRAGEFARVVNVDSTTVTLDKRLYDGYSASSVDVYRLDGSAISVYGSLSVFGVADTAESTPAIRASLVPDLHIESISAENSDYSLLQLDRCYNVTAPRCNLAQTLSGDTSNSVNYQYGLQINNCEKVRVAGEFSGFRHGATMGSADRVGGVPNRNCVVVGNITGSGDKNIGGAMMKPNTQDCAMKGRFFTGVHIGGADNIYEGEIYSRQDGVCVHLNDLVNTNHSIAGAVLRSSANPMDGASRGVIDLGGNTVDDTSDTEGGVLDFSGVQVYAPLADRIVGLRIRNTVADDIDVKMDGMRIMEAPSGATTMRLVNDVASYRCVSGYGFWSYIDGSISSVNAGRVIGFAQFGSQSVVLDSSTSYVDVTVPFDWEIPVNNGGAFCELLGSFVGSVIPVATPVSVSKNEMTVRVATPDNSNFAADSTETFFWQAFSA